MSRGPSAPPTCVYCKGAGAFSDELSGSECYCLCPVGRKRQDAEEHVRAQAPTMPDATEKAMEALEVAVRCTVGPWFNIWNDERHRCWKPFGVSAAVARQRKNDAVWHVHAPSGYLIAEDVAENLEAAVVAADVALRFFFQKESQKESEP